MQNAATCHAGNITCFFFPGHVDQVCAPFVQGMLSLGMQPCRQFSALNCAVLQACHDFVVDVALSLSGMPRLGGTKTLIAFAEPSGVMKLFDIWKCPIDPTPG